MANTTNQRVELDTLMTTGVTSKTALSSYPNASELFQKMQQGFISGKRRFKCRGGFMLVSEFTGTGLSTEHPVFTMVVGSLLFVFNGDLSATGSRFPHQMRYTTLNIELGTIVQENAIFLGSSYVFYIDQFDAVHARVRDASGSQLDGHYWFVGGGDLYECTVSTSTGLFSLTKTIRNTQPYAITQIGSAITYLCYEKSSSSQANVVVDTLIIDGEIGRYTRPATRKEQIAKSSLVTTPTAAKRYGRILALLPAGSTSATTYTLLFDAGEFVRRSYFFAETLFFVSNKGLRAVEFRGDSTEATAGLHRRVSTFEGRNVPPRSIAGQAFVYYADEIRLRDISSMQTGIAFAGDYVATPMSPQVEAKDSCYLPQEDVILTRSGPNTVHALWVGKEQGFLKVTPTVFVSNPDWDLVGMTNSERDLILISAYTPTGGTDLKMVALKYDSTSNTDYIDKDTADIAVLHDFTTARFPYVGTMEELRLHIEKTTEAGLIFSDDSEKLYDEGVNTIITRQNAIGSRYYTGDMTISFTTSEPIEVLTAKLFYTPVAS